MKKIRVQILISLQIAAALLMPAAIPLTAAGKTAAPAPKPALLEVSGWIPYWRTATGTVDAMLHMDTFKELSPFGYTVKNDGTLFDAMNIDQFWWQMLIKAARAKKVKIIPTVTWSNTESIHAVLKSPKLRKAHISGIVKVATENGFDGIDIDYEGKMAETRPYFSFFLRDLYKAMGKKIVSCTIEARTPLASRFDTIPEDITFANDYTAINKYCDRVRIMTYDQGSIDLRLNEIAMGPYIPVADTKWVEKVITLAAKSIAKKKIVIGVATYGYEFDVTPLIYGFRYDLVTAFNQKYALDLARELGISPHRNLAGELSFAYTPTATSRAPVTEAAGQSNNAFLAGASVSLSATTSAPAISTSTPFRLLWWSDASAIQEKINLARKLGVRGIAIFKIDGGEDPVLWTVLRQ